LKTETLSTWISSITIEGGKDMEMKNPAHPGELVKACLDDLGLSVAEAAKGLGITRQQLHNVIAARSSITPEMAIRFEKAFGSTADTWLRMQMNYDLAQMRQRASGIVVERLTPKVA
jgi:addiction module HigA family antidote